MIWITGLPASGKSTLAVELGKRLEAAGIASCTLDSDEVRVAIAPTLGYDDPSRERFYEALGRLAALLAGQGLVVLVPATANRRAYRERARASVERFFEVWVDVPLDECRRRDTKGLYAAFDAGQVRSVPGEDAVYEPPLQPDVVAWGGTDDDALAKLVSLVEKRG